MATKARTVKRNRNSRAALTQEIEDGRRTWEEAVAGLSDKDFLTAEISRGWMLKDVLAHLASYLELNARHIRAVKKRKRFASMRAKNWYQFNKREAARNKKMSLKEARRAFENAYADLLRELATLNDDALLLRCPSPWSENETRTIALASVLRGDVSSHLREHARDVEKWRLNRNDAK